MARTFASLNGSVERSQMASEFAIPDVGQLKSRTTRSKRGSINRAMSPPPKVP
jgi:hypothetical protein